jgi:type II secretion system protein H
MIVRPSGTSRSNRGFSLLELLTVLLLLSLIAGITAPAVGRFLDNLSFRKQTATLLAALRYARLMAISKGEKVVVAFEDAEGTVMLFKGGVEETREFDLDEDASFSMESEEIIFYPEGQATPVRLSSSKGDREQTILIDPLTAIPLIE